jgi:hypothetical protein
MTKALALGLIVTSPVIRPTSWNSSYSSRYFWLLRACGNENILHKISELSYYTNPLKVREFKQGLASGHMQYSEPVGMETYINQQSSTCDVVGQAGVPDSILDRTSTQGLKLTRKSYTYIAMVRPLRLVG